MRWKIVFAAAAALLAAACVLPPVNRDASVPLGPLATVDPERYAGRWYEIARLPNIFERDCEAAMADYALRADGRISVRNTCRTAEGRRREAAGSARIVDPETNAKLKVRLGGPWEGDYWVLDRADDYSWSLVGEPSGRFLWILARTRHIGDDLRADLLQRLEARGYDTTALYWPEHP